MAVLRGHRDRVLSVAISTDGQLIVSGGLDNTIRLWNRKGSQVSAISVSGHQGGAGRVAISTDGQLIVSGSNDDTVRLWNRKGNQMAALSGHQGGVNSVAISTNGQLIVSGGDDGTVRLWDIRFESWLKTACERLRDDPVLKTAVVARDAREAKATCEPFFR